MPGHLDVQSWPAEQDQEGDSAHQTLRRVECFKCLCNGHHLVGEVAVERRDVEAQKVLDLQGCDDDPNTGGEPNDHRIGDNFDQTTKACQSHQHQNYASHEAGDQQTADAVLVDNRQQHHHERRGRTRDIHCRAASHCDHNTGDDRRVQPVLRWHTAGYCQGHRQRQGNDADRQSSQQVGTYAGRRAIAVQGFPKCRKHRVTFWGVRRPISTIKLDRPGARASTHVVRSKRHQTSAAPAHLIS